MNEKKSFKDKLDGFFEISSRGSSFKVEALAGIATFFSNGLHLNRQP